MHMSLIPYLLLPLSREIYPLRQLSEQIGKGGEPEASTTEILYFDMAS